MIDDDAIARCQGGDRDAFRHLVDRYKDVMYGTAVLMTGNRAVAEETVQEAFLSAWRGIEGFKRGRPPKPWLIRILVNRVMDERRRQTIPTVPLAVHPCRTRRTPSRTARSSGRRWPISPRSSNRWWCSGTSLS